MGKSAVLVAEKCCVLLLTLLLGGLPLRTCDGWDQSLVLDNDGKYVAHWSLGDDETIKFMVEVETQGYVGFGLSMTGGMAGSDIVTGWIDNGIVSFQDRYGLGNFIPQVDDSQDWELLSGSKNGTHTVLTFRRKLNTCDKEQDIVIDENRIRLIYAYSEDVPKSPEDLQYHQWRRGIKGAGLLERPIEDDPPEKEIYYWDAVTANFTLTSQIKSMYWCTVVKGPELPTKHHIIKYEPITTGGSSYVHHIAMFECTDSDVSPEKYEKLADKGSYTCGFAIMYDELERCTVYFAGWAAGTEHFVFRKHTGRAIKARPPKYYRLVIHYENPSGNNNIILQSGLRFWYTPELRKYDVGIIRIGAQVSPLVVIPPAQDRYIVAGHASPECLASSFPPEGVNITEVTSHVHLLGRKTIVRHFRGTKELKPILRNDHFDFHYQDIKRFRGEIRLLPGDHLVVECTYNSTTRSSPTFAGATTQDEMCFAFLMHYPLIDVYDSLSQPSAPLLFGLTGLDGYMLNMTDDVLRHTLESVDWNNVNASLMEAATRYSPHESYCISDTGEIRDAQNMVTYPRNYEPYTEVDKCLQIKPKQEVSSGWDNKPTFTAFVFSFALILYVRKTEVQ